MTSSGIRVLLVVPTSRHGYFDARRKHSIAWYAKRALTVSRMLSSDGGVDVFHYGHKEGVDETAVLRTELKPDGVDEWVLDWAVLPNADRGLLGDLVPKNPLEGFFGVTDNYHYRRPLKACEEVCRWTESLPGDKLVIFWLDWSGGCEELVRAIARLDRPDIFWQFFGHQKDLSYDFWRKDGLKQGQLLPNVRARDSLSWNRRSITRGFRKWRG
ncbi:hypothetical protein AB0I84_08705 [Streptomyces spectabilis]|uniref:hypothetical protein n=1 Tax=Streptomyces spectabilis TaxID=68270 RepID=UPI0033F1DDF1